MKSIYITLRNGLNDFNAINLEDWVFFVQVELLRVKRIIYSQTLHQCYPVEKPRQKLTIK